MNENKGFCVEDAIYWILCKGEGELLQSDLKDRFFRCDLIMAKRL